METRKYDAVIIGGGVGGLACAASLSSIGKRVLLLEQHHTLGGYLQTYRRKRWRWDVGTHYMTDMVEGLPYKALLDQLTGGQITFTKLSQKFQKLVFPGFEYTILNDKQEMKRQLLADFPEQRSGIETYWGYLDTVSKHLRYYLACKRYSPRVAQLLLPLFTVNYWPFKKKTHQEVLDKLFTDTRLKQILCFTWPSLGTPPARASFIPHALSQDHIFSGTYYPNGGGKALVDGFLSVIQANGGEVRRKTTVEAIRLRGKRAVGVVCERDGFIAADAVISAIGLRETVHRLLPGKVAPKSLKRSIFRHRASYSSVVLSVGLEGDISSLGIDHATYRIFSERMAEFSGDPAVSSWQPSATFITFPTLHNGAHEDPEHHTVQVITNVSYDFFDKWSASATGDRAPEYTALKEKLTNDLLGLLSRTVPGIEKFVAYTDLSTPLTNEHYVRRERGAIYGLELTPERLFDMNLVPRTEIEGLYLTGADIFAHGIVQGIIAGILTAGVCAGENLFLRFLDQQQR